MTVTQSNGCVNYTLWGNYTRYNVRVVIVGVTPDQPGIILGASRFFAPGAYGGRYNLGTRRTALIGGSMSDQWLDQMDDPSSNPSPAMLFAGYSDKLGLSLNNSGALCPRYASDDVNGDGIRDE